MNKKQLAIIIIVFLTITSNLFSTTGKLKGVVTNENGETLVGANITIEGTTLGAETDEDGLFYILGINMGTHKVECSYMGYNKALGYVKIRTGLSSINNFKLYPKDYQLNPINFYLDKSNDLLLSKVSHTDHFYHSHCNYDNDAWINVGIDNNYRSILANRAGSYTIKSNYEYIGKGNGLVNLFNLIFSDNKEESGEENEEKPDDNDCSNNPHYHW